MNGRKREAMCPASYVVKPIPERGQTTGMANRTPKKKRTRKFLDTLSSCFSFWWIFFSSRMKKLRNLPITTTNPPSTLGHCMGEQILLDFRCSFHRSSCSRVATTPWPYGRSIVTISDKSASQEVNRANHLQKNGHKVRSWEEEKQPNEYALRCPVVAGKERNV